jgi:hypothetical protein
MLIGRNKNFSGRFLSGIINEKRQPADKGNRGLAIPGAREGRWP